MKLDLKNLPNETKLLHRIITDLLAENQSLQEQLKLLKRKYFGSSSEKIKKKIDEIELRLEETESSALAALLQANDDEGDDEETKQGIDTPKDQPKRKKLPENLERINVVLSPDPKCPECNSEEFRRISDDISEILEYIPSSFKVLRHIRPRCVCINCDTIVQAYAPSNTIDKGKAGPGLLAHILVQKYCNHLPMYRQSEIYEREGIDLARSTMANWAGQVARLLEPLIEEIRKSVFSSTEIHGDDTTVKVLAPGLGKTKIGRIWAYVRDGRPYGDSTTPPAVCYFYSPDRKGIRPQEHLKNFEGILHADAYSGYDKLYTTDSGNKKKNKGKKTGSNNSDKSDNDPEEQDITCSFEKRAFICVEILKQISAEQQYQYKYADDKIQSAMSVCGVDMTLYLQSPIDAIINAINAKYSDEEGDTVELFLSDITTNLNAGTDHISSVDNQADTVETEIQEISLSLLEIYRSQITKTAITEAACWAHTRHNFHEVTVVSDNASIAVSTLEQIAKIYAIEDKIRGLDPDQRRKIRQEESKDLILKLFVFWKKALPILPAQSRTAKAINYAMNNKEALMRFLNNGKIEIDNNAAERSLRVIALGRKNWLFAGSDRGGETAANIYTIMGTLKLNKIDPWKYLSHVLANIQDHNSTKIAELLPWNVKLE